MDRTYWVEANDLLPGEKVVAQQATVRLYDGEEKVQTEKCIPIIEHHPPKMFCRQHLMVELFSLRLTV